jgi:hypothetical protein
MRGVWWWEMISTKIQISDMTNSKQNSKLIKDDKRKTYGENPLQSKWYTPGPFIVTLVVAVSRSRNDNGTN